MLIDNDIFDEAEPRRHPKRDADTVRIVVLSRHNHRAAHNRGPGGGACYDAPALAVERLDVFAERRAAHMAGNAQLTAAGKKDDVCLLQEREVRFLFRLCTLS